MRLGVLFSGGKDSTYALSKAMEKEEVVCLISVISKNTESYMFHTPNIHITDLQAEAIGLPLVKRLTEGKKEEELNDLKAAIKEAKDKHNIEGIVTGAIESVYQAERVQRICDSLGLWCFNPLWMKNQEELMRELVENNFKIIISGIFAYPLNSTWIGKEIDNKIIDNLLKLRDKYSISPSGEGGEIETTVLDAPFFKKKIDIIDFKIDAKGNSGAMIIKDARLISR